MSSAAEQSRARRAIHALRSMQPGLNKPVNHPFSIVIAPPAQPETQKKLRQTRI